MSDFLDEHTEFVAEANRRRADRRPLFALAGLIVVIGIAVTWWFQTHRRPPTRHPDTALYTAAIEPRIALIEAFRSSDGEGPITEQLKAAGLAVRRSAVERPDSERYPPRRIATVDVESYQHLGSSGTLRLEFFNNRLMEADFRPEAPGPYAAALHRRWPALARDSTGHAELVDGALRIWSSVDLAKSKVGRSLATAGIVLWQDQRLIAQRDEWDARFGNIAPPAPR